MFTIDKEEKRFYGVCRDCREWEELRSYPDRFGNRYFICQKCADIEKINQNR